MHEESLSFTHTLNDTHTWNVTFVSDYATITTTVIAEYGDAIEVAQDLIKNHYGLSLNRWRAEFELAKWGEQ
jgi:hypothetical protein